MGDLQPVKITELVNAGKFKCSTHSSEEYLEFLGSLNTYFEKKKHDYGSFIPQVGDLVAVHQSLCESPFELWYRAKIVQMFQQRGGILAKMMLVDEDELVCSPKARMRPLPEKFMSHPHRVMTCVLNDLVPVTIGASMDLRMSLKKSLHWDNAATTFMEKLVKDADISIKIMSVDEDNTHHVELYVDSTTNVNGLLVKEKYAALKSTDDKTLSEQSIVMKSSTSNEATKVQKVSTSPSSNDVSKVVIKTSSQLAVQQQKQEKLKQLKQRANKDVAEYLRIINGDVPQPSESSGASDASDMENTPAPAISNYRRIKPGLNAAAAIANKLGKESSDYISKAFGLKPEETSSTAKRVSFSQQNEVLGTDPTSPTSVSGGRVNNIHQGTSPDSSPVRDIPIAKSVDSTYLLRALDVGGNKTEPKKVSANNDRVLVYGKLKRDPFQSINQLNVPLSIKSCLSEMNALDPTPFQKYMWSAIASFRNVVGIAEGNATVESKVLGYVLPILCKMLDQEGTYRTLGKQNAPFLIICVAGWQEARHVYDICEHLTRYYRKVVNIDVRYGGMDNVGERNIRLLNGVDILITTVRSLNYVVEHAYIKLDRLCHVVFDNADILVETFTEGIKIFMRTYWAHIKKSKEVHNNQIIAVSKKWSYGIHSLTNSYLDDPLVIIANNIEMALYVKVPIVPEICNSSDRLEHLIGFLETDAADENSIIFTNSAVGADKLHESLKAYSIITSVITEYTSPLDMRDMKLTWTAACMKSKSNIMILSDNAVLKANITNASCLIHYDYPQKKSHFGHRLTCLLDTIRENENKEKPKPLLCQIFITEKNNGVRYCTGLVKLIKRSGQKVPDLLRSMAESSHELKEEQKEFSEICPRLKLFGECKYIEDCMERHTIFVANDLLELCPSTGFIKVVILDVISASSFWGRIVEHRLPYDPEGSAYDTTVYLKLAMDMQLYYSEASARTLCVNVEKYDVCVLHTIEYGYQRVRVEKILEKEFERPKSLEVFGIDNGFTSVAPFSKLIVCAEQFRKIPPQAVEVIACCVKPIEQGSSWTDEASKDMESKVKGKHLEGRVQFSLQNTIWVDPLVEKKVMCGIQTKAYSIDVGRDLLNLGYAERNTKHVEQLRKLLFDVQGHPIEVTGNKQNLPASMIDHEWAYLNVDDYEEVYVSAVVDPGLFFVQRVENQKLITKLDNKIDATMSVKNTKDELVTTMFPIGYICVAEFSGDQKWYRAQILGISKDQYNYDIFFVDHGDREWVGKSKVAPGWPDILTEPFQAIECSFKNIESFDSEWTLEDGDVLWDLVENKLLSAKMLSITASSYINDTLSYEIELYDTTCNQTQNINHELVFLGVAKGSLQCLQEMFPHASISQTDKVIKDDFDLGPDLCVEIHQSLDLTEMVTKAEQLKSLMLRAPLDSDVLVSNGTIESVCKLLALTKKVEVQEILLSAFPDIVEQNERCAMAIEEVDGVKAMITIMKKTDSPLLLNYIVQVIQFAANDSWSLHILHHMGFINSLCDILRDHQSSELLMSVLDALNFLCRDNESNCTAVRQAEGLQALCTLYETHSDIKVVERCTGTLKTVLANKRNKEKIREIGGLQILASLLNRKINEPSFKNVLQTLLNCIEDNEENREYLHKINAHTNLVKCSKSSRKLSMITRIILNDLIQKLTPAPITDFLAMSENDIDPSFKITENGMIEEEEIPIELKTPKALWSQRLNTVTISIGLRGVDGNDTDITKTVVEQKHVYFRTVLYPSEYKLWLDLYANIVPERSSVKISGGEVLFIMFKEEEGVIWPRLLSTAEKLPYIGIDFDRWVDEYPDKEIVPPADGSVRFQPDLPEPPPCQSYDCENVSVDVPGSMSTDELSSDDEEEDDIVETIGSHPDYFNI